MKHQERKVHVVDLAEHELVNTGNLAKLLHRVKPFSTTSSEKGSMLLVQKIVLSFSNF